MELFRVALIISCLTTCVSSNGQYYLTKNSTKLWFKNFTKNVSPQNPYCSICCIDTSKRTLTKICGKHTMCIYRNDIQGPRCKGFLDIPFVGDEIDVILDAHNTIRNKVAMGWEERGNPGPQPKASNMRVIEWNADLALIAHRWASQCVFGSDLCRDIPVYPVGQNIAKGNFATNHDLAFITEWYDYVQYFSKSDLDNYQFSSNSPLRQYTQLVWAETYQVGCARVLFQQNSVTGNTTYREHFVCNYGPTGNILGQSVYTIGRPCSNCPEGTGCSVYYTGLCGSEINYEEPQTLKTPGLQNGLSRRRLQISVSRRLKPLRGIYYFIIVILLVISCY